MAKVMIGCIGYRGEDGDFLPAKPIYREIPGIETDEESNYLPMDALIALFADKYKAHLEMKKKQEETKK